MKDELHSVLDKFLPEFLKENIEPNIVCWRLHLSSHLSKDECDTISSKTTTIHRFLAMFELLKPKPDDTFLRLQEICIEMGWMGMLNLIQSTLSVIEIFHDLIIEDEKDVHYKYGTNMNEYLCNVLDILMHEFLKSNADPDSICSKLLSSGHLAKEECDMVESTKMTTAKFVLIFTSLKSKPEHILKRLQEIYIETDLIAIYKLVQSKLAVIESCSHLMMTEEEFISYQENNKERSKIQNWEPVSFDVRDPTINFIGRDQQLTELHYIMQQSAKKIVITEKTPAITGLGGIGKTQLALKYVQLYRQQYDNNIIWINAESEATLRNSFISLAEKLNINIKNAYGVEKETARIFEDVYTHFSKVKCLFVFDNAEEALQEDFYPSGQFKIFVLITSRCQKWGQINIFQLENFSKEEAIDFIRTTLKIQPGIDEDQVTNLAKTLHFFPLALKQATAYIEETSKIRKNIDAAYSIDNYINEYNESKEKLLNYKFNTDYGNEYFQTTFTTWKITINKLAENITVNNWVQKLIKRFSVFTKKTAENMAINILDCVSYFAHEQIDMQIFVQHENKEEISVAIRLLEEYSLVTEENGLLNVHPLVQEMTRLNIKQKKAERETFKTVYELVETYFKQLRQSQDYIKLKIILPHSEKLLQEMKNWLIKSPLQQKYTLQKSIKNLLIQMSNAYFMVDQQRQEKSVLEQLLSIQREEFGPDHYEVARTLVNLANAYRALGQPEKQKTLLEKALVILEKHYGPDHYQVAIVLTNLGNVYAALGHLEKQKTLLEKALKIQEKHYGPDHYEVAGTLVYLGDAYGALKQHEKKKTLLEKVLVIKEKRYGPDHYEVAITLANLGNAYGALGHPEKQKLLLERALATEEKHYGPDHYEVARTLINLSKAHGALGQSEKQIILLIKALTIQEEHYGPDHYEVALTLIHLSNVYGALGQPEKQKTLLEIALVIQEKHYGPDHYEVALTLEFLSNAYGCLNNFEKQKTLLEKTLAINKKHFGQDHYELVGILKKLSDTYENLGDTENQECMLEKISEIKETCYSKAIMNVEEYIHKI